MKFEKWLKKHLEGDIPESIVAFNFNLYECSDEKMYDVQLVGSSTYNIDNDDWACNTEFSTGEDVFTFSSNDWEAALDMFMIMIRDFMATNKNNRLIDAEYVTAGFVDGDLNIVSLKNN